MSEIKSFRNEYAFLSNFYPAPVTYEGITYPTTEHAFQGAKCLYLEDKRHIADLKTPQKAKRYGRKVVMRNGWDIARLQVMYDILKEKFADPTLQKRLLDTGNATLIEGNHWNDTFWGVSDDGNGHGENHLGKTLMAVRDYYRTMHTVYDNKQAN